MSDRRKEDGRKSRRRWLLALEIACIAVAVVCGVVIFLQASGYWTANNEFNEITETYGRDIDRLETDNPNCVGWVSVADTRIDYPVMYTPDDPEYYLHRNFEGEYSSSGTPFLGKGCVPDGNSIIIYGHHMNDGSMFASLIDFDDPQFGLSHSIEYKTVDGVSTYLPFACFYEDLTTRACFRFWDYVGELDEQRYNEFVSAVKAKSLYDFGREATYDEDLLMMSTCSYNTQDERFVVVAVKVNQQGS